MNGRALAALWIAAPARADVDIRYRTDSSGWADPTPTKPVGGNIGTTLGEQRDLSDDCDDQCQRFGAVEPPAAARQTGDAGPGAASRRAGCGCHVLRPQPTAERLSWLAAVGVTLVTWRRRRRHETPQRADVF